MDVGAFQAAWDAGLAMPLEDAVAYALDASHPVDASDAPEPAASNDDPGISPREREVLRLLVDGMSNQEIAEALFISPHTVASHVANIMNKLGVESRTAAATYAVRNGLI
jgi:DNA-binding CsgD family transcriptional regulator